MKLHGASDKFYEYPESQSGDAPGFLGGAVAHRLLLTPFPDLLSRLTD